MSSVVQDIQLIRSLRKNVRNPRLPQSVLKSIETIQSCIANGADQNGWRKVEWRSSSSYRTNNNSSPNPKNGQFFSNRSSHSYHSHSQQPQHSQQSQYSQQSFNNRSRHNYTNRETNISIPLTNPNLEKTASTDTTSSSSQHKDDQFEVVRHNRRFAQESHSERFHNPPQKYVSKFKKNTEKVEDTILNTILLGKLNKFSVSNYTEIKEFITHIIASGQTDMVKCFMKIVFEKAASEEIFCPLYAKLLSELSIHYPVLLTEMANLYAQYMLIFEEVTDGTDENYSELCERNIVKKYRRGYSQFLAELIKYNVIDMDTFMKTVTKIISQIELNLTLSGSIKLNEEFADCLMKIMKAIQTTNCDDDDDEKEDLSNILKIRTILKKEIALRIQPLTIRRPDYVGLSNKARFTFLDIYENIQRF
jgi:hypothetical protein